ncbi:MAG: phosphatidyl-myo-inositol alpha-mannosyltransferase, partial [Pseudonocardiales bacterium]|nr:phosphatidyl-myo-inositol alpha-mannosyltransferase [Pseudonocardiales bacterium]
DEPRKGMSVLLEAMTELVRSRPGVRLLVAGRGQEQDFLDELPDSLAGSVVMLGMVSEHDKAALLRSVDVYVAPNTGGESFGIILLEALAAEAPIVASDLPAFRRVLDPSDSAAGEGGSQRRRSEDRTDWEPGEGGSQRRRSEDRTDWEPAGNSQHAEPRTGYRRVRAGLLFRNRDSAALAQALEHALSDAVLRRELAEAGAEVVRPYDWQVVTSQILRVYEIACAAAVRS